MCFAYFLHVVIQPFKKSEEYTACILMPSISLPENYILCAAHTLSITMLAQAIAMPASVRGAGFS